MSTCPWVKFDDDCPAHPKIKPLSDLAFRLWFNATCWCSHYGTDGTLPGPVAPTLAASSPKAYVVAQRQLVDSGLWEPISGGYRVHDYLHYQFSKAERDARRDARSAAGQEGNRRRWEGHTTDRKRVAKPSQNHRKPVENASPVPDPVPDPVPLPIPRPAPASEPGPRAGGLQRAGDRFAAALNVIRES